MNDNVNLRIGFIGAGRVGTTLGKYFRIKGSDVAGYYSRTRTSAKAAASFTDTAYYDSIDELISDCNMLFLTVPDSLIEAVWNEVSNYDITGKYICHCSGAMSSSVFKGISDKCACGYSIHPLCAIESKTDSYKNMNDVFFCVESNVNDDAIISWLKSMGNPVSSIASDKKILYHAAAVFASNLMTGLHHMAGAILGECGIEQELAEAALNRLFEGNCNNIVNKGEIASLTGPVDRNDITTIEKHMSALCDKADGKYLRVYKALSEELIDIAKVKNPDTDYDRLNNIMGGYRIEKYSINI